MKKLILVLSFLAACFSMSFSQTDANFQSLKGKYIQLSGSLFREVQLSGIFKDSKTFVDAIPLSSPENILKRYDSLKAVPDFDLMDFVRANFRLPEDSTREISLPENQSMSSHIASLWKYLERKPDPENQYSTLLPLKYPYIVPGGRFREIYYWDSFFTILGLLADGKEGNAENMVRNFAYLIDTYGMIPNGNRVYYLTRSQPPFFALMVDIISRFKNDNSWGVQFLPQMEKEYYFWMSGKSELSHTNQASDNVVRIDNGGILNRYYDLDTIPREESFKEDYNSALKIADSLKPHFFRNLRAAAESGWDFSSRWFKDGKTLQSIQTTDILPVDLNCLLWFLEERLSFYYRLKGDMEKSKTFSKLASSRSELINTIFWNKQAGFYFDYNWKERTHTKIYSPAGSYPMYFGIARPEYAESAARIIEGKLLKPGGIAATMNNTKQQWDAPNGWPPLQWMTIKGLREYEFDSLADKIKSRWLKLNDNVYKRTGRMVEKYNVEDIKLFAGGGEYKLQDGFGWTNGVASALSKDFDKVYLLKNLRK